jgi:hypothetical protein
LEGDAAEVISGIQGFLKKLSKEGWTAALFFYM